MSTNIEKSDVLTCGACGYDNGVQHLIEKQALMEKVYDAEKRAMVSDDTRQTRAIATAIAAIVIVLILAIAGWATATTAVAAKQPQHFDSPMVVAYKQLANMYDSCITASTKDKSGYTVGANPESIRACNEAFNSALRNLENKIEAQPKTETSIPTAK